MQIKVSGKGVDVGESLRQHIEAQVKEHVTKYINRISLINVVVSREGHRFRVDITGNLGTHSGMVVRSRGELGDVYAAFDESLGKMSKQLRRYKRKLTNHHAQPEDEVPAAHGVDAMKYILPPETGERDDDQSAGLVIAEKATHIGTMTVSEAVMKMDLQELPALMFFNSSHGRLNVVYRRVDGNISWVDPNQNALRKSDKFYLMKLAQLLPKEAVFPHVEARDKKQSLKQMSALAADVCGVSEKEIYATLMEREHHGTTCMGSGVCVPHGCFDTLKKPYAFFARFNNPIEFNGEDGKPVDLMFLLLSPENENTDHLKSLALLSRLLRNKNLCSQLRKTESVEAIYGLLDVASKDDNS